MIDGYAISDYTMLKFNTNMQQTIQSLIKKEMTRKEFLAVMGFGVASIFGFSTIIKLLAGNGHSLRRTLGYGSTDYGGKTRLKK